VSVALLAVALLGPALLESGCSTKQGSASSEAADGDASVGASSGLPGHDTNPDGVPYPAAHIGVRPRGMNDAHVPNATPGDVIANYKFLGYPNGDPSSGLQVVALADYFDPQATKYKVVHIIAAASWCPDCADETSTLVKAMATASSDPRADGVVYLQALIEGATPNFGATQSDLNLWIQAHSPPFTTVLDPEAEVLGVFFDADSVPFNADIDARSMELLATGTGYQDPIEVKVWTDWVNANPPAYP